MIVAFWSLKFVTLILFVICNFSTVFGKINRFYLNQLELTSKFPWNIGRNLLDAHHLQLISHSLGLYWGCWDIETMEKWVLGRLKMGIG